ncbi:Uncharacterized protein Rs2_23900 [Raphanus sativus]|nr:Uncharacterized protein Rs2_23900 [Raphanus sativus]
MRRASRGRREKRDSCSPPKCYYFFGSQIWMCFSSIVVSCYVPLVFGHGFKSLETCFASFLFALKIVATALLMRPTCTKISGFSYKYLYITSLTNHPKHLPPPVKIPIQVQFHISDNKVKFF